MKRRIAMVSGLLNVILTLYLAILMFVRSGEGRGEYTTRPPEDAAGQDRRRDYNDFGKHDRVRDGRPGPADKEGIVTWDRGRAVVPIAVGRAFLVGIRPMIDGALHPEVQRALGFKDSVRKEIESFYKAAVDEIITEETRALEIVRGEDGNVSSMVIHWNVELREQLFQELSERLSGFSVAGDKNELFLELMDKDRVLSRSPEMGLERTFIRVADEAGESKIWMLHGVNPTARPIAPIDEDDPRWKHILNSDLW